MTLNMTELKMDELQHCGVLSFPVSRNTVVIVVHAYQSLI